jgi:hypothetical protein
VIDLYCLPPDSVQVSEIIDAKSLIHPPVARHPEERSMFFAELADLARTMIMRGQSCVFNVYLREP